MIAAWSFSRLKVFEQCPYRAKLQFVDKLSQDHMDRTAANRGTMVHDAAEKFVRGEGDFIKEMEKFREYFHTCKEIYNSGRMILEEDWGFNSDWNVTGYWDDDIWLRMKLDQFFWDADDKHRAKAVDLKTGKLFGNEVSHNQQGQLYAIGAFMRYADLQVCDVNFVYLDQGKSKEKTYTRAKAMKFLPMWDKRAKSMTLANKFPPKPNSINCRFCPWGTSRGDGSCEWGVDS